MRTTLSTAVTAAAAALAQPSFAGVLSAEATIGSLTIQVVDLDPGDGIPASFTLFDGLNALTVSASQTRPFQWDYKEQPGLPPTAVPYTLDAQTDSSSAFASIGGDGTSWGSIWSARGGVTTREGHGLYVRFEARGTGYGAFTLTPSTLVKISALASVESEHVELGDDYYSSANALAYLSMSYRDAISFDEVWLRDVSGSESRVLEVSATSDAGSLALKGYFVARALAYGGYTPYPVPEPESYVLMAGGLVVLGALLRRRRAGDRRPGWSPPTYPQSPATYRASIATRRCTVQNAPKPPIA